MELISSYVVATGIVLACVLLALDVFPPSLGRYKRMKTALRASTWVLAIVFMSEIIISFVS
jgi:hypothetical protein